MKLHIRGIRGRWYIIDDNITGEYSNYLRNDGVLSTVKGHGDLSIFYFNTRKEARVALANYLKPKPKPEVRMFLSQFEPGEKFIFAGQIFTMLSDAHRICKHKYKFVYVNDETYNLHATNQDFDVRKFEKSS